MRLIVGIFFSILFSLVSSAQFVSCTVKNERGEPLPFSSIIIKDFVFKDPKKTKEIVFIFVLWLLKIAMVKNASDVDTRKTEIFKLGEGMACFISIALNSNTLFTICKAFLIFVFVAVKIKN